MLLPSVWRTLPSCTGIWLGTTGRPVPVEGVWPSSLIPGRHAADPGKKLIPPMNSSEAWGRERGLLLPEPELADSGSFPHLSGTSLHSVDSYTHQVKLKWHRGTLSE